VPVLVRRWLPAVQRRPQALRVPFYVSLIDAGRITRPGGPIVTSRWLAISAWAFLVIAAARPVYFGEPVAVTNSGRDLLLAVDISDSMKIDDMLAETVSGEENKITRLEATKQVAADFIQRRDSDRVGLILFGQRSYLQTPLTFDRDTVVIQLNEALAGFAGSSTAIGDAIGLAVSTLRDRPAPSRVLVLLTDGANTAGSDPMEALEIAIEADVRIHTIGIGADVTRVVDGAGRVREIDPSKDLDEQSLRIIAGRSGGEYFRARDPQQMAEIYLAIDQLEPTPEQTTLRPQKSLFHWPLAIALAIYTTLITLKAIRLC